MKDDASGVLSGQIHVDSSTDKIYEVFYERPYIRPPSLKIWQKGVSTHCEIIEQRTDGFKIKGRDFYKLVNWEAKGEFVDSEKTYTPPSFAYSTSIFGAPNKKYTYDLFVLMPFTASLKPVYDYFIKKVAQVLNLSIARADNFFSQNSIM